MLYAYYTKTTGSFNISVGLYFFYSKLYKYIYKYPQKIDRYQCTYQCTNKTKEDKIYIKTILYQIQSNYIITKHDF